MNFILRGTPIVFKFALVAALALTPLGASNAFAQNPVVAAPAPDMTRPEQHAVVDALIREMNERYVFPAVAKAVEAELKRDKRSGAFATAVSGRQLADLLTIRLRAIAGDKHLAVKYSAQPISVVPQSPPEDRASELRELQRRNFSPSRVETLEHNIGYLNLRGFDASADAADTISAAMRFVAHTDALIVDLRENGGGYPDGVAQLESYFFDERTHLNDMQDRDGTIEETWTFDKVAGPRYGEKRDVYILTSRNTFSGGEDMAYTMQALKRATVVGEVTGGGANPGSDVRLNSQFRAFIPFARAVNPITKTNWEGKGVQPDIAVSADKALQAAQLAALRRILPGVQDEEARQKLTASISLLEREF